MRKTAWGVVSAALVAGCGGSGSAPVEAVADADSAVDTGSDSAPPESDASITQLPDASVDSAVARQDKDADNALVIDAALPAYFPGSPTPSTPGCTAQAGDASDLTCCAMEAEIGSCLCGSAALIATCFAAPGALSSASTCYEIQRAWSATGLCTKGAPPDAGLFVCSAASQCPDCTTGAACCTSGHACSCTLDSFCQ